MSVSGYAEMGIVGGSNGAETQFHTDIDVTFSMSGSTDNGLTFGAAVDLDESLNQNSTGTAWARNGAMGNDAAHGGVAIFLSGGFGTLTMGDTDGALDWATSETPIGSGSIADDETAHGRSGVGGLDGLHDGQILRYNHSVGGLGFAVSIELDDSATATADDVVGLGLTYSIGDLGIGLGYQNGQDATGTDGDETVMAASLRYSMGDLTLGAIYYNHERDGAGLEDETHVGIGMSYTMDAITVGINYGETDNVAGAAADDQAGWGFSAGYDLGGGASILFGYGDTTDAGTTGTDNSTWSLGLAMSF